MCVFFEGPGGGRHEDLSSRAKFEAVFLDCSAGGGEITELGFDGTANVMA